MKDMTLGDIADYINGRAFKPTEWEDTGLPIIRIQNLNNPDAVYNYTTKTFEDKYIVNNGDLLFAWSASLGAYIWGGSKAWLNQHIFKVVPKSGVDKYYLYFYLLHIVDDLYTKTHGSGMIHITLKPFKETRISLPTLFQQRQIVLLIESLFEKLDRAKELAQNALDSFENRKFAILQKAFTGELTAKWREDKKLKNVDSIVSELYIQRLKASKSSIEESKIRNIYNNAEVHPDGKLPEGWKYVCLDKLCESFQYGTSNKSDNDGKVIVLRMGNLQSGKIDWTDLAYSSDENDIKKYLLKKGDVLFNRTNSPELVGKTSIYNGEKPAIFAGYLIRINNFEQLDSYYLNYVMNSAYAKEYCINVKNDGINQSNINAQKLAKFEIPFCSLEEQKEIVRILDNLLEKEEKAKELCDIIEKIDLMKKTILAKAFRGELGTNNPEEESAIELLKEVLKKG